MLNPIIRKMSSILFNKESELVNDEDFEDITERDMTAVSSQESVTDPLFHKEDVHD